MKTLTDWLDHCERLHPKNIDMGLERVRAVGERLGLRFRCPVITVAGTNGKGSTCAMLEAILGHAGYRTGVYTSPHLVHFEERLRLLGTPVDAARLVEGFARVEAARVAPSPATAQASRSGLMPHLEFKRWVAAASISVANCAAFSGLIRWRKRRSDSALTRQRVRTRTLSP